MPLRGVTDPILSKQADPAPEREDWDFSPNLRKPACGFQAPST